MLKYGVAPEICPEKKLADEINLIVQMGVELKLNCTIGQHVEFKQLCQDFDAVFVATGVESLKGNFDGLELAGEFIKVDKRNYTTNIKGVFAGGDVTGKRRLAIRSIADGKEAAFAIDQFLSGKEITGSAKRFNSRMGKCSEEELGMFILQASEQARLLPDDHSDIGFPPMQAVAEAKRCLHCDCRKPDDCKLRLLAEQTGAKASAYKSQRKQLVQDFTHADIVFEPGKCINCGLCIQVSAKHNEQLGLTFTGRGFDIRVDVPFGKMMSDGLKICADECVRACPTGALAYKEQ